MNIHDPNVTVPKVTTGPLPASRKVYVAPDAAPDLRVPVREIALDASSGEPPLPVYDTTGAYTDPDVTIDVEKGLSRASWGSRRAGPPIRVRRRGSKGAKCGHEEKEEGHGLAHPLGGFAYGRRVPECTSLGHAQPRPQVADVCIYRALP